MGSGPLLALMRRESRGARGRLVFMTACLALGVAAVTGVAALVGSIAGAVERDARSLLAADLTVEARQPLGDEVDEILDAVGAVRRTDVVEMASMVRPETSAEGDDAAPRSILAELKAAGPLYPLHGEVVTEPAGVQPAALADDECVIASEIAAQLGVSVGESLRVGKGAFRIAAVLVDEPDRVDFAMTLGPRVFVSLDGLKRTGLMMFGSRIKYRRLVGLAPEATSDDARRAARRVKKRLDASKFYRVKSFDRPNPSVDRALDNVGSYLGLVALLSLLLGGIGVAQVVRAWLGSRTAAIATLRSIGFRPREVFIAYLGHVVALALIGCAIGIAVGLASPYVVQAVAPELMESGAGPVRWAAAGRGLLLGLGTAIVFSVPPLTAVWRVSPARALRAEAAPLAAPRAVRIGAGLAVVGGVLSFALVQSGEVVPALIFTAGLAVLIGLLTAAAALVSRFAARVPRLALGPTLRHGVAALARPGAGVIGAAVALGLGTLVVVALGIVGARLEDELVAGAPPDAPTLFLVDVQPDQWDGVREMMEDEGAEGLDSTPVVMTRLAAIDGTPVSELLGDGTGRTRWTLTREQRITWSDELPGGSTLAEGTLWSDPDVDEVSVETDFAKRLGVGLGSTLTFDVQGVPIELRVTSLRDVDWASFRINFFLLAEPGALRGAPGWRLAAAKVDPSREDSLQSRVVEAYPNVSVLRIRPLMERVAATLGRIATAVRLLGAFTVLVGIAILAGAIAASSLKRGAEAALLKTLGVTRRGVALLFAVEYGLLGLVAGLVGGLGALALAWAFLHYGLELDGAPSVVAVPLAALGTAVLAAIAGLSASARALRSRPIEALRG
ncbi:MAG: FtsX-like permease family protein [Planctomycetota bacterium]